LPENVAGCKELACGFNFVESKGFNSSLNLTENAVEVKEFSCGFHPAETITFNAPQVQLKTIDSTTVPVLRKA
jgi:hypothetical protein